jgi:hypothetical protein
VITQDDQLQRVKDKTSVFQDDGVDLPEPGPHGTTTSSKQIEA